MDRIIKESLIYILNERIDDIWKRIDQIDKQTKEISEFIGWYNFYNKYKMPPHKEDNEFDDIYDVAEIYYDAYKGLMEEREQLFKLYQQILKELNDLYKGELA